MTAAAITAAIRKTYTDLALGIPVVHDNDPAREPASGTWVRLMVNEDSASQIGIGGSRKQRTSGLAEVWVLTDVDQGDDVAMGYAIAIEDAYSGSKEDPVTYRAARILPRGRRGKWHAIQVLIEYFADVVPAASPVVPAVPAPDPGLVSFPLIQAIVRTRFEAALPATVAIFDNDPLPDPAPELWVRVMVLGGQRGHVQGINNTTSRYRREGNVTARVHATPATGDAAAKALADSIADLFRSVTVPPVVFAAPVVRNTGRGGNWWTFTVDVPYHADRVA